MQREPRRQVDMKTFEEEEMEKFRRVFAEELGDCSTKGGKEVWITFKEALRKAENCLPLATEIEEKDWMTDKVQVVSRKKQEAWMRWVKSPKSSSWKE